MGSVASLRVAIAQDRIRVGVNTPGGENGVEVREPSVEPAQRGRHAVAGSEQTEDPACGTAGIETGREPSCTEILGNDTMNVSKPTFIVCLKEACPERIFDRRAEWQLSYIGSPHVRQRRFPDPPNEQ